MKINILEQYVRDFHSKFGATIGDIENPRFADKQLRINLIQEEFNEFVHEVNWDNFDKAVHELIDLLYVTFGALIAFGVTDIETLFRTIHEKNMEKVGGKTREDGKVMKPEGWTPADLSPLIHSQKERMNQPEFNMPIIPQETIDKIESGLPEDVPQEQLIPTNDVPVVQEVKRGRGRPRKSN